MATPLSINVDVPRTLMCWHRKERKRSSNLIGPLIVNHENPRNKRKTKDDGHSRQRERERESVHLVGRRAKERRRGLSEGRESSHLIGSIRQRPPPSNRGSITLIGSTTTPTHPPTPTLTHPHPPVNELTSKFGRMSKWPRAALPIRRIR